MNKKVEGDAYPWSGGFRTLAEEHDYRIDEIEGQVPPGLRGTLYRNGSGRNDLGGEWFPHWFDGDGMISAIRFDDRGIHYRNRYVATENYRDETRAGHIVNRGFGKQRPHGMLGNAFRQPANVSNTSVVMQGDRLLSLWEGGPPFALDPVTLDTRGIETFGGTVKAFSAHPKIDPDTGEMFNFGIDYGAKTTLTPYRIDKGITTRLPPVTLPHAFMNHDFVLTTRYLVFCLGPIILWKRPFVLGQKSFDHALFWDNRIPTLILLVPRDGSGKPRIIETDPFFQFHFANGFEEDGALILDLARYPDYHTIGQALRDYWKSKWPSDGMAALTRMRVRPGDRQDREQDLRQRHGQRVPAHQSGLLGQAPALCLHSLQPVRPGDGPAAAARARRPPDRRRGAARFPPGRLSWRAGFHRHAPGRSRG